MAAKIKFIRVYESFGVDWCDIVYESNRLRKVKLSEAPSTAVKYMARRTGRTQFCNTWKRAETIYSD